MSDVFTHSFTANLKATENYSEQAIDYKGLNWLGVIAATLGKIQGDTAARMLDLTHQLQKNADAMPSSSNTSDEANNLRQELAAEANVLNARLQGEAQMFKIQSEATSTVIKAIGDGNSSVARRQ